MTERSCEACGYPTGETDSDDRCIRCGSRRFSKLRELNRRAKASDMLEVIKAINAKISAGVPVSGTPSRRPPR